MTSTPDERTRAGAATGQATAAPRSLTALQCELRALFASRPTNRALHEMLERIGGHLGATYAVVHARLGVHILSEEWVRPGLDMAPETKEIVNTSLWEAMSVETTRCTRLQDDSSAVISAVMYGSDVEPSGGAALVLPDCDREHARDVMVQLDAVLGYLSLLLDTGPGGNPQPLAIAERREIHTTPAADHPVRLAMAIAAEIENRHGCELTAVGFVKGHRIEVVAVSGTDELRAANPGVVTLRSAMEECLDRGDVVVSRLHANQTGEDDCRLHAQWSAELQGNPVASFPLQLLGETVAVVSLSQGGGTPLSREQVLLIAEEMAGYAPLVPLSRAAARTLPRHALDAVRGTLRRITGRSRRRAALVTAGLLALVGWLAFGTLDYSFTVPCAVKAANRRTISCPREGTLAELFVRPGDQVRQGQLLASLDANDDFLRRAELLAEIESLEAQVDRALAERETGQLRVHEARKRSLLAQVAVVEEQIKQAQIHAPQDGILLEGDLREHLGGRLRMGEPMFELARYDRAAVVLEVPEKLVLAAHESQRAVFSPKAQPDQRYELEDLFIAPASTIVDQRNVFLGEALVRLNLEQIAPGMEGVAHLQTGRRSAWWVLTHRLTDWLRLNFWI